MAQLVRRRLCRRWARSYAYPGSIRASFVGARVSPTRRDVSIAKVGPTSTAPV